MLDITYKNFKTILGKLNLSEGEFYHQIKIRNILENKFLLIKNNEFKRNVPVYKALSNNKLFEDLVHNYLFLRKKRQKFIK